MPINIPVVNELNHELYTKCLPSWPPLPGKTEREKHYVLNLSSFKNFLFSAIAGTIVCELISSGSYYFFNVPGQASFAEFAGRIIQYLPYALEITMGYLFVALVAHLVVVASASKVALSNKR